MQYTDIRDSVNAITVMPFMGTRSVMGCVLTSWQLPVAVIYNGEFGGFILFVLRLIVQLIRNNTCQTCALTPRFTFINTDAKSELLVL